MTLGARPVLWDRMKDNRTPAQRGVNEKPMTTGNIPGKRLSIPLFLDIVNSNSFRLGLWREDALCTFLVDHNPEQYHPEDWFHTPSPSKVPVKIALVCGECEVRLECLSYAITLKPEDGVWAGHTAKGIKRMARKIRSRE